MTKNKRYTANLAMLETLAIKLGDIKNEVVFLGGSSTALFITDREAPDIRATIDVDCIVDIISLKDYYKLECKLIKKGFKKALDDEVICRWHFNNYILDIMPTNEKILGFSNYWYTSAIKNTMQHQINETLEINTVDSPHFIGTKLESFKSRGKNDYLLSHDLEDIITIIDGRVELFIEVKQTNTPLKKYICKYFKDFLNSYEFITALPGHLNYGALTDDRVKIVLNRMKKIAKIPQ